MNTSSTSGWNFFLFIPYIWFFMFIYALMLKIFEYKVTIYISREHPPFLTLQNTWKHVLYTLLYSLKFTEPPSKTIVYVLRNWKLSSEEIGHFISTSLAFDAKTRRETFEEINRCTAMCIKCGTLCRNDSCSPSRGSGLVSHVEGMCSISYF